MKDGIAGKLVGSSMKRVEDARILAGHARYVDDVQLPDMLHAAFLRSSQPHARIARIDVAAARKAAGVVAVFTGEEIRAQSTALKTPFAVAGFNAPSFYALATDKVRFVGDPVVMVVAESRYLAEDACELIELEYEPLAPVLTYEQAMDPNSPALFDDIGHNVIGQDATTLGDIDGVFTSADRVVRETFHQHRYANNPLETRGTVASFDAGSGELIVHAATQAPHGLRYFLASLLNHRMDRLRVLACDVGGAFGLKLGVQREDVALCVAVKQLSRPVKWIEDRNEHLMAAGQAREETIEVEAAVTSDGSVVGLKAKMIVNLGAYPTYPLPIGAMIPSVVRTMLPGPYKVRAISFESTVVTSNKCPYVAYRGPWEIECWVRERLLNIIAREIGMDPAEIRRRNLVTGAPGDAMITGPSLAGISSRRCFDRALEFVDYEGLRAAQTRARVEGRHIGIGFATYIEAAPGPRTPEQAGRLGAEWARVRLEGDGHLTVITAQSPHGQGHETTLAQVAADEMGVPFSNVRVIHGDTQITPFSMTGTSGSRSATMAGGAVLHTTRKVKQKILALAGDLLEMSPEDLEIVDGVVSPRGVPQKSMPLAQIAAMAHTVPFALVSGTPDGSASDSLTASFGSTGAVDSDTLLEATGGFDGGAGGWSGGTHVCVVEVDVETGQVRVLRYVVVEDCGTPINPAIVEGQIRGGVAQGIGCVLYEHCAYDDDGQYLAGTLIDYLLPTAMEIPRIEIDHVESPPTDEVNFRGVGEGGMIVAPATLTNAIDDALAPLGVTITQQYLPPGRILELTGAVT